MPKQLLLKMAFDAGYDVGTEDAGSGELLVETLDLRYALYDLDGKTKRAVTLDALEMAVQVETTEHERNCRYGLRSELPTDNVRRALLPPNKQPTHFVWKVSPLPYLRENCPCTFITSLNCKCELDYRAIVMCPPHLTATWQAELAHVFPDGAVDVQVLQKWTELIDYPRTKPTRPTWLIISETLAKNGPYWRPAAVKDSVGILRCPECGSQLRTKAGGEGDFLTIKDVEKARKRCNAEVPTGRFDADGAAVVRTCGAPLWQYIGKPAVFPTL